MALQTLTPPPVLPDRVAGLDFDAELATEGVGILDIRSVYDFDGVDIAPAGIAALADPARDHRRSSAPRASCASRRPSACRTRTFVTSPDRVRRHRGLRHARDPGLRHGRARRLGAREGAGQRARSRSRCSTPTGAASARATTTGCRCARARSCAATAVTTRAAVSRTAARTCSTRSTTARRPTASRSRTRIPRSSPTSARRWRRRATRISCQTDCAALDAEPRHRVRRRVDRPGRRGPRRRMRASRYRYADLRHRRADERRLHRRLARGLSRDDPLREPHPSAVEQAAHHARRRRRDRADRRHLHGLSREHGRDGRGRRCRRVSSS